MIGGWVTGVDVARHQQPSRCDWARARDAGLDFAFVKLTEGADYVDPAAGQHVQRLRRVRTLPFGVYHFARPDFRFDIDRRENGWEAGRIEAAHFLTCYEAAGLCSEAVAIDLERKTSRDVRDQQRGDFVRGLVTAIKHALGWAPIIYTGDDYWRSQMPDDLAEELRAEGCVLWLATYTRAKDPVPSETIPGWPWSIWQWSGGGNAAYADPIPGLPHPVDQNRYRGSLAELRGLMGVR